MNTMLLTVSSSPHTHSTLTVPQIMRGVIIAMVPALLFSVYTFGVGALYVTVLAVVFCVAIESVISKGQRHRHAARLQCAQQFTVAYNIDRKHCGHRLGQNEFWWIRK